MQKLWNGLKIPMPNPKIWPLNPQNPNGKLLLGWLNGLALLLGSPPWLNAQIEPLKPLTDPLNPRPVKKFKMGEFFPSTREFFPSFSKNSRVFPKNSPKTRPSFSPSFSLKLVFLKNSRVLAIFTIFSKKRVFDDFLASFWEKLASFWKNSAKTRPS